MKIIEGQIENLFVHKAKYDFIQNSGKQATVSAALGAAVGSATLASQAVLIANSKWDVKECSFEINGYKYEGIFEDIYFSDQSQLICMVQNNIALVLIDPKDNKMYIPIGTGDNRKKLQKRSLYFFIGFVLIGFSIIVFSGGELNFIILAIFITIIFSYFFSKSMYKSEESKVLLTEKIIELLGVSKVDNINLSNHAFVDEDQVITKSWVIEYQEAFKENNPYPKDYFEKKNDQN